MDIISVTKENIEKEHICCAISNNKNCQVSSKKSWLNKRFEDGLVFKKCNVRGKCFIEYIPYFFKYKGFKLADTALPYFELLYLPFNSDSYKPSFKHNIKSPYIEDKGFVLFYTNQCPFTAKYVPIIEEFANNKGIQFKTVLLDTREQAQNAPSPFTSYSLFYNGKFINNEILSIKKFEKIIEQQCF
ncbi:YoaP domain-containing protein [Clostridium thermobutyricum]|uniref:YoaP domain-containing protein n=1 Tax=Clostridium thermobutyricum TaxID=29372 RepID=UPI002942E6F2|nr:YoaP domain-containing protein [Clostridium thermobutyricum]